MYLLFGAILSGSLMLQSRYYMKAHNESIKSIIEIIAKQDSNLMQKIVKTDEELIAELKAITLSLNVQSKSLDKYTKEAQAVLSPVFEEVPLEMLGEKERNVQDFVYTLELAKDRFAISSFEKSTIKDIINRIKHDV